MNISQALSSLYPTSAWEVRGTEYADLVWLDTTRPQPTEDELTTEAARLLAVWTATQYRRDRVYPPIGDQLDDLFRQGAFSPEMAAQLQAVKTAHPKGTL